MVHQGRQSTQRKLFVSVAHRGLEIAPGIRPHFAHPKDTPRLAGQNAAILTRLRQGPARNHELADIALKYTSRISDVRSWLESNEGKTIKCRRLSGGVTEYSIGE